MGALFSTFVHSRTATDAFIEILLDPKRSRLPEATDVLKKFDEYMKHTHALDSDDELEIAATFVETRNKLQPKLLLDNKSTLSKREES